MPCLDVALGYFRNQFDAYCSSMAPTMMASTMALVLAVFLLNFWIVHHIGILVGASAARGIIAASVAMATAWILSFGGNKSEKPES